MLTLWTDVQPESSSNENWLLVAKPEYVNVLCIGRSAKWKGLHLGWEVLTGRQLCLGWSVLTCRPHKWRRVGNYWTSPSNLLAYQTNNSDHPNATLIRLLENNSDHTPSDLLVCDYLSFQFHTLVLFQLIISFFHYFLNKIILVSLKCFNHKCLLSFYDEMIVIILKFTSRF